VSKGETERKTNLLTILDNRYSGEAASSVFYGPNVEELEADILSGVEMLQQQKNFSIRTLHAIDKLTISPIARSALMAMILNYLSGKRNLYPWEVLKLGAPVGIRSSMTVSIDEPAEMAAAIRESSYPIIKIKMGANSDRELLDLLEDIGDKELRVDANGGWDCETAEEMIYRLSKLGVRVIEQPTDLEHIADWPYLKGKNDEVELIVDEGLETVKDFARVHDYCDGVNIKMEKSGGIIEAVRIAKAARRSEKKVMLGCMVESSVGIAQSVYMSSLADYHDLDGPLLLESDIGMGINYDRETIHVDREIIGGPALKRDVVQNYIQD